MILIAFGANLPSTLGSPQQTYEALPDIFAQNGIELIQASPLYQTAPVPASDQPDYHNGVLSVKTDISPHKLMQTLLKIEEELGRERSVPNAARGVDLDLIAYDDRVLDDQSCTLPHPRMHQRRFVLEPLCDLAPNWRHPILQKSAQDLLRIL